MHFLNGSFSSSHTIVAVILTFTILINICSIAVYQNYENNHLVVNFKSLVKIFWPENFGSNLSSIIFSNIKTRLNVSSTILPLSINSSDSISSDNQNSAKEINNRIALFKANHAQMVRSLNPKQFCYVS
jgi:hypothetical protein